MGHAYVLFLPSPCLRVWRPEEQPLDVLRFCWLSDSLETRGTASGRLALLLALRYLMLLFSRMNRGDRFRTASFSQSQDNGKMPRRLDRKKTKSTGSKSHCCGSPCALITREADHIFTKNPSLNQPSQPNFIFHRTLCFAARGKTFQRHYEHLWCHWCDQMTSFQRSIKSHCLSAFHYREEIISSNG